MLTSEIKEECTVPEIKSEKVIVLVSQWGIVGKNRGIVCALSVKNKRIH